MVRREHNTRGKEREGRNKRRRGTGGENIETHDWEGKASPFCTEQDKPERNRKGKGGGKKEDVKGKGKPRC